MERSVSYTGRCACGAVTARMDGKPLATRECWCRQCQQVAAGGPTRNAMFPTDDFHLAGSTANRTYIAASGNTLTQHFCPGCGTPLFVENSARPHHRTVRLGFLDLGHGLRPSVAIWLEEAPDWAVIDPALERFERQAPPPVGQN